MGLIRVMPEGYFRTFPMQAKRRIRRQARRRRRSMIKAQERYEREETE